MKRVLLALLLLIAVGAAVYWAPGLEARLEPHLAALKARGADTAARQDATPPPAVSVVPVAEADFTETVSVSGSLVPRDEILVAPEVEGFRVLDLKVDEGDHVKKGDVLATLVQDGLDAQLAQSDAALARAEAAISRARSLVAEADARRAEAEAQFERAKPLKAAGHVSESVYDQREAAAKSAAAQLVAAEDGLRLAEAEKAQAEAQRRELAWRRSNALVKAPADGLVSRRTARIGGLATVASEPMFRIIARGEVELDAEVIETELAKVAAGQKALIEVAGVGAVEGTVRLVSPEVDKATRLGRVRIFLGADARLRIGSFARGTIDTARGRGLAVPSSAVVFDAGGAFVQIVREGRVVRRDVETGLVAGRLVEVRSGLAAGDLVVARAGTFLREGDAVRAVAPDPKISEAR